MSERSARPPWTRETLLIDGDAFFDSVVHEISEAKSTIEFETYIFRDDAIGQRIAKALVEAASRGVSVRLIVDGIGASGWFEKHAPALETRGVHVRVYHPVLFSNLWTRIKIDLGILTPPKAVRNFRGSFLVSRFNRRDHRKLVVIDDRVGFVGSVNVTSDHSAKVIGARAWRDTSVRVEGPALLDLAGAFDAVWERCHDAQANPRWRERLKRPKPVRPEFPRYARFNYTARLRKQTYRQLIRRISRARTKV